MADEDITLDGKPLQSLRVADLKAALEQRNLPKSGQKNALIKRLKGALMLENLQKSSSSHCGLQPNSQIGEEMSQNSFIKQYLAKQQELLHERLEREAQQDEAVDESSAVQEEDEDHSEDNDSSSYVSDKNHSIPPKPLLPRAEERGGGDAGMVHGMMACGPDMGPGPTLPPQEFLEAPGARMQRATFHQGHKEPPAPSPPRAVASLSVRVLGQPDRQGLPPAVPRAQEKEGTAPSEPGSAHPVLHLSRSAGVSGGSQAREDSDDDDSDDESEDDEDWGPGPGGARRGNRAPPQPQQMPPSFPSTVARSKRKLQPPQHIPPPQVHHTPMQLRHPTPPPSPPPDLFPLPDTPKQSPPDTEDQEGDRPEASRGPRGPSFPPSSTMQRQDSDSSSRSSSPEPSMKRRPGPLSLLAHRMDSEGAFRAAEATSAVDLSGEAAAHSTAAFASFGDSPLKRLERKRLQENRDVEEERRLKEEKEREQQQKQERERMKIQEQEIERGRLEEEEKQREKEQKRQEEEKERKRQEEEKIREEKLQKEKERKHQEEEKIREEKLQKEKERKHQEEEKIREEKLKKEKERKHQEEEKIREEKQQKEKERKHQEEEKIREEKQQKEKERKHQEEEKIREEKLQKEKERKHQEEEKIREEKLQKEKERKQETVHKGRVAVTEAQDSGSSSDSESSSHSSQSSSSSSGVKTGPARQLKKPNQGHKAEEEKKTDLSKGAEKQHVSTREVSEPSAAAVTEVQPDPESSMAQQPPSGAEAESSEGRLEEGTNQKAFAARKISLTSSKTSPPATDGGAGDCESGTAAGRKRRWGSSSAVTTKKPSISITTDSLKSLIPDIRVKEEAVVELHPEELQMSGDEESPDPSVGDQDKGLKIRRTVTQVVPGDAQENGQTNEEEEVEKTEKEKRRRTSRDKRNNSVSEEAMETQISVKIEGDEKKVTPSDSLVRRSISQQKSGVSVTIDDPVRTTRQPSPPQGKVSKIIHVTNLVRPFTLGQLKELLNRTGSVLEDCFWIDKIKSHCFVTYGTTEEAVATRAALHGVKWPSSNPKVLNVDFCEQDEMDIHKGILKPEREKPHAVAPQSAPPSRLPPLMPERDHEREQNPEWDRGMGGVRELWVERQREMERRERARGEREWDRDKVREFARPGEDRPRSRSRERRRRERAKSKERKTEKKGDEPPAKLLDDLFLKTKAAPCIYWLPLSEEQAAHRTQERTEQQKERVQRRKERQEELEKKAEEERERLKERLKAREKDRGGAAAAVASVGAAGRGAERERERGRDREPDRKRDGSNRPPPRPSVGAGAGRRSRSRSNPRDRRR
ncbi:apoptotic chromatin condensation inducer 1b isoform X2 [Gymnodraco acuticeps]|uniref:Apoptotic chromatin condensation inducer 1b isoform X2 n=1 Tax=Gymnodraco acuticeps TaxID=8218 RepID=A0A6P8U0F3_GYMAC|nr:apoptotic chromatin condensation inducer 1b isoform X2 [Gymnodraco acuticeps]